MYLSKWTSIEKRKIQMPEVATIAGYQLLHDGILTLADIEFNGINVDVDYVEKQRQHLSRRIDHLSKKIEEHPEMKIWKKVYPRNFNMDSTEQLSNILFKRMDIEPNVMTSGTKLKPSVSEEALEQLDLPFTKDLLQLRKLKKTKNTYLNNYLKEEIESILRPFFHLHTTVSFRSSCSAINFQNQPIRIPWIKRIVRRAVIPRPRRMLGELDYSGIEVSIATCYHKDPNMIRDIVDPKRNMHRDMAVECYKLNLDQCTDDIRYCGKNMFVFPEFYGDYYINCANSLWNAIAQLNLKTNQGLDLKTHLKNVGLGNRKKFENHIKKVEEYFWGTRYRVYGKWKEQQWKRYLKDGYVELLSGFICKGLMSRNEAINYPVQGAAFHCLLWSLIRINKWLKDNNMLTLLIGQIHDSIVFDFEPSELDIVLENAIRIMTEEIRKYWSWIIVPLKVDVELSPVDGSWFLKKEVTAQDPCICGNRWLYKTGECPICKRRKV